MSYQDRKFNPALVGIVIAALCIALVGSETASIHSQLVAPRGTSFDYYLVWVGAREVLAGHNPFTPEIAARIQLGLLGHLAQVGENQYYYVYPPHIAYLLAPLLHLEFEWSLTIWLVLQQAFVAGSLMLILRTLNWRLPSLGLALLAVGSIAFRYVWVVLVLGQTTLLVLFLIAAAMYATHSKRDVFAGLLLASATFKPQLVLLPALGWVLVMLQTRSWRPLAAFSTALIVLWLGPALVIGNWIPIWLHVLSLYAGYNAPSSALTVLGPSAWGVITTPAFLAAVLSMLVFIRYAEANRALLFAFGIILTALVMPTSSVYDLAILLLPWVVCLWLFNRSTDWSRWDLVFVAMLPVLSWMIVTVFPSVFEMQGWTFDAVSLDKVLAPALLLAALLIGVKNPVSARAGRTSSYATIGALPVARDQVPK